MIQGIGQVERDVSDLKATREVWTIPLYVILASVLVATVAVLVAVGMLSRRKRVAKEQVQPENPRPNENLKDPGVLARAKTEVFS